MVLKNNILHNPILVNIIVQHFHYEIAVKIAIHETIKSQFDFYATIDRSAWTHLCFHYQQISDSNILRRFEF